MEKSQIGILIHIKLESSSCRLGIISIRQFAYTGKTILGQVSVFNIFPGGWRMYSCSKVSRRLRRELHLLVLSDLSGIGGPVDENAIAFG